MFLKYPTLNIDFLKHYYYTESVVNKCEGDNVKIGYIRVSSMDQHTDRQEVALNQIGVEKYFIEKISGKDMQRPKLQELLDFIREDDIVFIESISRLARNTRDLLELVEVITKEKKAQLVSLKEQIDTSTPTGKFMLTVFGAVAQLERDYIKQRQREGIDIALLNGTPYGRPKIEIDEEFIKVYNQWKKDELTAVKAMQLLNLKRSTFYRRVKEYEYSTNRDI